MGAPPWATAAAIERYRAWRALIPFTNDQIADAILENERDNPKRNDESRAKAEHWAGLTRSGMLTRTSYCIALPYLVKRCEICGRKAIYRIGPVGRCSAHRDTVTKFRRMVEKAKDDRSAVIDDAMNTADRRARIKGRLAGLEPRARRP